MRSIAFVACLLIGAGCSTSNAPSSAPTAAAPAATAGLQINFKTLPDPPRSGDNQVEAVVTMDGAPVSDATVSAVFSMPAMPSMNMPEMHSNFVLNPQGDGRYQGSGQLEMGGTWNVAVNVTRGDQQLGSQRFTVIAK